MATDIAFALGVLALLGRRMPPELRVFLLGLAVVDDLGVIAVIATFYTDTIHWANLGLGVAMFVLIAGCIRMGVRSLGFYLILAVVMWQFFLESGIHATLPGVLLAAIVPSKPDLSREEYAGSVEDLLHDLRLAKEVDGARSRTWVQATPEGLRAFAEYLSNLHKALNWSPRT